MEDRPSDRDLLIALAATSSLSRAAVCRLAAELDRWARGEDPFDLKARASELALPPTPLSRARALAMRMRPDRSSRTSGSAATVISDCSM